MEPERLLIEVSANMFRGLEAVGGKLTVTNRRLVFRPHAVNVQTQPEEVPIENLAGAAPCNTLGIVPNGMLVTLKDGSTRRFVVSRRSELIGLIKWFAERS